MGIMPLSTIFQLYRGLEVFYLQTRAV